MEYVIESSTTRNTNNSEQTIWNCF